MYNAITESAGIFVPLSLADVSKPVANERVELWIPCGFPAIDVLRWRRCTGSVAHDKDPHGRAGRFRFETFYTIIVSGPVEAFSLDCVYYDAVL